MKSKLDWKHITSLFLSFAFVIISISGLILFIAPPGRIAHWTYWAVLGLTKTEWQAIHIIFTFSFIFFMILHIIYNWKFLIAYMRLKVQKQFKFNLDLTFASVLTLLLFFFTLAEVPPMSTVVAFGESISDSWSSEETEPPIPHAEEMTLVEIAEMQKMELGEVITRLNNSGYIFDSENQTLSEIGEMNDVTPDKIFNALNINSESIGNKVEGSGYGRMILSDLCNKLNLPIETAIQRLKLKNIEASSGQKIKEIAMEHKLLPIDIVNIIENK